jgi:hypothetical protein
MFKSGGHCYCGVVAQGILEKNITNSDISLASVKGIVAQWKGYKVDWAKFATKVQFQVGKHTK